ncbi:MAG: hypothetical protein PHI76_02300 [Clostridia bacterium]|nr:hypothetical protein [Clostridia bacterium]
MQLDDLINLTKYYDIYKNNFNSNQQEILNYYLYKNLQISEIAEIKQVTRQAIFNLITLCTQKLQKLENDFGFCVKLESLKNISKKLYQNNYELQNLISESKKKCTNPNLIDMFLIKLDYSNNLIKNLEEI